jgi:7-carboxy-7-deazaguanine synthase
MNIPVAEIFGPTIQGEGQLAGRSTYFLRVGGCDFSCAWCDSAHAVKPDEVRKLPRLTQAEIIAALLHQKWAKPGAQWLTISGGNPALYEMSSIVSAWQDLGGKVAVETQGSRWQDWLADIDLLTISPKPPSSAMINGDDFRSFMVKAKNRLAISFRDQTCLKVVVFDEEDYTFAVRAHKEYPKMPFYLSCGTAMGGLSGKWTPPNYGNAIMTFGHIVESKEDLLARYRWLAEKAMADTEMADVAIYPQLQALIWGITTKGV